MSDRTGIYVHVPFCARVCPYCDFAVRVDAADEHPQYVKALLSEIERVPESPGTVDTIYLGGGTPSRLGAAELARILFAVAARWPLANDTRITLEANPEDVNPPAARDWAAMGVHTVSLGVQSFDDAALRLLGRVHRAETTRSAVDALRAAGVPWLSIDLIFGLPGQEPESWEREIGEAVALAPEHVSCYQLTIHEGTPFHERRARGRLTELGEELQGELFLRAHELLAEQGYEGYEVSNFARGPEHRSRHNAKYWRHVPYIGVGPSAHSYLDGVRWWNRRDLGDWTAALTAGELPREGSERLGPRDIALERILLGLRTADGVDLVGLHRDTGIDVAASNVERFADWEAGGLARVDRLPPGGPPRRIVPTVAGMAVAEALAREVTIAANPLASGTPPATRPVPG